MSSKVSSSNSNHYRHTQYFFSQAGGDRWAVFSFRLWLTIRSPTNFCSSSASVKLLFRVCWRKVPSWVEALLARERLTARWRLVLLVALPPGHYQERVFAGWKRRKRKCSCWHCPCFFFDAFLRTCYRCVRHAIVTCSLDSTFFLLSHESLAYHANVNVYTLLHSRRRLSLLVLFFVRHLNWHYFQRQLFSFVYAVQRQSYALIVVEVFEDSCSYCLVSFQASF